MEIVKKSLHKDHINDLYTTTCSSMLGHRSMAHILVSHSAQKHVLELAIA
jgi:hypothetical protein